MKFPLLLALPIALVACGGAVAPASTSSAPGTSSKPAAGVNAAVEHVNIATATISANQMPVWIAADGGLFPKNGLEADVTGIAGSNTVVAAMVGGSLDVGQLGGPGLVNAGMGGADVVMFAGFLNKEDYRLMADPSIKTLNDLKGKTVAITSFGAADDFILRKVLVANNLKPDADVKIVAAKDNTGQLAAMSSHQVQAA
ncbi:MAG: ABC transporter substrate-binding protein, partial [Chloroflexi bacterium]|nr:ABC transporter substrate-binding protein [Chloroflexota bacterium]